MLQSRKVTRCTPRRFKEKFIADRVAADMAKRTRAVYKVDLCEACGCWHVRFDRNAR